MYKLKLSEQAVNGNDKITITVLKNNIPIFIITFHKINNKFIVRVGENTKLKYSEGINFLINSKYCNFMNNTGYFDLVLTKYALISLL